MRRPEWVSDELYPFEDRWEEIAGATVHYVDEGVDTGAVILAERVPVQRGDTVDSLRARVQAVEHRLLPKVVRQLCER